MTPVSLLTCWIATSAGPSASDCVERRLVDQAVRPDRMPRSAPIAGGTIVMFGRAMGPPRELRARWRRSRSLRWRRW